MALLGKLGEPANSTFRIAAEPAFGDTPFPLWSIHFLIEPIDP
jgi:hypothetical protein